MPKIDTGKIEGFDTMTAEEKLAALLGLDIPDEVDLTAYVSKTLFDKTASELAEAKKTIKGNMSAEEIAKVEAKKAQEELQGKYDELLEKYTVNDYKTRYIAMGYDEKLAEDTAKALFEGKTDIVFANGEKFRTSVEQRVKTEVLQGTPKPDGAGGKEKPEKTADVELAERIGKANAEANKTAQTILSQYSIGGND